jgi:hypothetical protein
MERDAGELATLRAPRRNVAPTAWHLLLVTATPQALGATTRNLKTTNCRLSHFSFSSAPLTHFTFKMADRFPSLDEIDAGKSAIRPPKQLRSAY